MCEIGTTSSPAPAVTAAGGPGGWRGGAGAASGAAGGAPPAAPAPAEPSSLTSARSVPTGTVWPSWTRIFSTVPATGEGTSVSTLSVEISKSGSSRSISSPSCFSHFRIVPSTIVSPSWGILIVVIVVSSPGRELLHLSHDVLDAQEERVLEAGGERDGHVRRREPDDRGVEVFEGLLRDRGCHLRADPDEPVGLGQDHRSRRLLDRPQHGLLVHGVDGAEIHDLDGDILLRQGVG